VVATCSAVQIISVLTRSAYLQVYEVFQVQVVGRVFYRAVFTLCVSMDRGERLILRPYSLFSSPLH
jgi:hypothetical protein